MIISNVLVVLLVPHVAAGPIQSGLLRKIEERTHPERKLCLPERSLRIRLFLQTRGKRNMRALSHMALLAGVLVAPPWVLVPNGVQVHRPLATGQRASNDRPTGHRPPASRPMDKKTHLADWACPVAGHQPPGIHRPPGKWARKRLLACLSPGTDHPVTGSLESDRLNPVEIQESPATGHALSPGSRPPDTGHQNIIQNIASNSQTFGVEFTSKQPS